MNIKSQIPNFFTLSNLLCGAVAVFLVSQNELAIAAGLILLAAVFDFIDGFAARLLGVANDLGKQLDSLADLISFGLAPAFIAVHLAGGFEGDFSILAFTPLLMAPFAAYRLGKFNIDDRQTDTFLGLPTPANALFWLSFPLILEFSGTGGDFLGEAYSAFLNSAAGIALASLAACLLMVSEIPMISLKFKSLKWKGNQSRIALIVIAVVFFSIFRVRALPIILLLYILLSIAESLITKDNGIQGRN
ncbi:MAG: CDP-diacylglycerol--serine O-phosphatidyltransferase [Cryomorphaceae bacterium]|nr:CDP-diacylglycerol--serine O-phosphatidyltransferase [Flavobacteriales bacterium]